jgi:protein transport protein SEC31
MATKVRYVLCVKKIPRIFVGASLVELILIFAWRLTLCDACLIRSDEERETWGFLRVMFEDGDFARTKLLAHLGFEPPQAPPASSTDELSQILADTLNIDHAAVTDNADAQFLIDNGDDFFNNPQPSEASLAEESVSTNGQQIEQEVSGDAVPSDPSIDKSIQHALVVGDYKGAVNQCLASNRMADALVIAHAGGSALWESTRNHYLKNSISPYLKVSFYFRF